MENYEVYIEVSEGRFELAPNPPPFEWRERKGVCKTCGEKVFVKAGHERCFWTHGKGKTCVPKPNPVSAAIEAAESAKNAGASTDGDDELKARFEAALGVPSVQTVETVEPDPYFEHFQQPPVFETSHVINVNGGISLGWVEASLVMCGELTEIKSLEGMPEPGTTGAVAILYQGGFSQEAYAYHVHHALEVFPGVVLPSYEEMRSCANYYRGTAEYEVVEADGKRIMRLSNVQPLRSYLFHICQDRMFWTLDRSDAQMLSGF